MNSSIIRLLPESLANQIAAGEVVQRPSSIIKELLENSIDAKSTRIELSIEDAGKQLIRVIDDGIGMSPIDAPMAFERHATSKIYELDDLFKIQTMGFRGEALASIAAVSQVKMKTRTKDLEIGTEIEIEGGSIRKISQCAAQPGTMFSVRNLFFNVPARRNFLKSNQIETKHILTEFVHIALAHPEVSFVFISNDEIKYDLPIQELNERIKSLHDFVDTEELWALNYSDGQIKISGYLGSPLLARKTKNEQFFFVNTRYIKSNYLHHAIVQGMERLLSKEQHPFYVINIEIPPSQIDINIHPTKTEIKFENESLMYGMLIKAITSCIGSANRPNNRNFETQIGNTDGPEESKFYASKGITSTGKNSKSNFFTQRGKNTHTPQWKQDLDKLIFREEKSENQSILFRKDSSTENIRKNEAIGSSQYINGPEHLENEVPLTHYELDAFQSFPDLIFLHKFNYRCLCLPEKTSGEETYIFDINTFLNIHYFIECTNCFGSNVHIQNYLFPMEITLSSFPSDIRSFLISILEGLSFKMDKFEDKILIQSAPLFLCELAIDKIIPEFVAQVSDNPDEWNKENNDLLFQLSIAITKCINIQDLTLNQISQIYNLTKQKFFFNPTLLKGISFCFLSEIYNMNSVINFYLTNQ